MPVFKADGGVRNDLVARPGPGMRDDGKGIERRRSRLAPVYGA